jgi:hypothetical protein
MNNTSVMKNNLVYVIYPNEFTAGFIIKTNGEVDPHDILEMVFAQWNHGSGRESEMFVKSQKRSLSVNDIVCVNGRYWQCASFGWDEVTAEYVNELESAVENHPHRNDGAWFALSDVMWERRKKQNLVVA